MKVRYHALILLPAAIALFLLSQKNFLLFHAVIEFSCITIYLSAVFLGFFASRLTKTSLLYGVSLTYLFLAVITFLHTLTYSGMGFFPYETSDQATQLWILGRYVHSIGVLFTILLYRKKNFTQVLGIFLAVLSFGGIALIVLGFFPACLHPDTGLTLFKLWSEYLVTMLLAISITLWMKMTEKEKHISPFAFPRSLLCFLIGGIVFTLYHGVYGIINVVGHMFYILGGYILLTQFVFPFSQELIDIHFFALNDKIRRLNRNLENRVRKRTKELEETTLQLEADVAKRKIVEENLIRAQEVAETALKAKGEFLATMSHEVRTPLSGILGIAEFLSEKLLPADELSKYISLIRVSGDALLEILNNILDLSKLEAGKQDLEIVSFSPVRIAETVIALFSFRAKEKGLRLTWSVDPELPSVLLGDSLRLRQILFNLIGNGIKFTSRGEVALDLKFSGREGEKILLTASVRDTGIGISEEDAKKIFLPFSQTDSTISRRFGGTGLGLTICRRTVILMGGTLDFISAPGEGSVFSFTLPFAEGEAGLQISQDGAPGELPSELTILLAEDNSINRMILENFLRRDGWTVVSVENGIEAVKKAALQDFSLFILDIEMPEKDGITRPREIRAIEALRGKRPSIIALSAHTTKEFRFKAEEAGMDFFLTKPIKKTELLKAISGVLASSHQHESPEQTDPVVVTGEAL